MIEATPTMKLFAGALAVGPGLAALVAQVDHVSGDAHGQLAVGLALVGVAIPITAYLLKRLIDKSDEAISEGRKTDALQDERLTNHGRDVALLMNWFSGAPQRAAELAAVGRSVVGLEKDVDYLKTELQMARKQMHAVNNNLTALLLKLGVRPLDDEK